MMNKLSVTWTTVKEEPITFDKEPYLEKFKDSGVVYYPEQFGYNKKSRKARLIKKYAKKAGYIYKSPRQLAVDVLVVDTLEGIKDMIDGRK